MAELTSNTKKSAKPAMTMAELLASHKSTFISPHKGDVLEGRITKLTSSEILVDIGAKTEALVLEKDKKILRSLLSNLKLGDKVSVSVLNPESDLGNPVVSLRRFIDDRLWIRLNNMQATKEPVEVTVNEATKGGFLVSTRDGIEGFLPNSQTLFTESGQELLGKTLKVLIIELNKQLHKIIFSQKSAMGDSDFSQSIKDLKTEQKIDSVISNIAPFGIFTSIQVGDKAVEGFIHISEISWEKTENIGKDYKVGDKLTALITGFDKEAKRVNLSLKRLTEDPFQEKLKTYTADKKVEGTVSKILATGLLVDLEEGVEGFIRKEKIPPTLSFSVGSSVTATVSEVDNKKHRVILVPVLKEKPIGYR